MIDIDKLQELRKFQSMTIDKVSAHPEVALREGRRQHGYYRRYYRWRRFKVEDSSPYKIAERVIKSHIGKSVNQAYHIYCKRIPKEYTEKFWKELDLDPYADIYNPREVEYSIDENFILSRNPKYKYGYKSNKTFSSYDHKMGWVHRITGKVVPLEDTWYGRRHSSDRPHFDKKEIYDYVTVSGIHKEFEVSTDREFSRLKYEDKTKRRIVEKIRKSEIKNKAYSFLTKSEQKIELEKESDVIRMHALGFDKDSFRGLEYHGCKRKRKKLRNKLRT